MGHVPSMGVRPRAPCHILDEVDRDIDADVKPEEDEPMPPVPRDAFYNQPVVATTSSPARTLRTTPRTILSLSLSRPRVGDG
jgi:hypothetical protein